MKRTNYNKAAKEYNLRYKANVLGEVKNSLLNIIGSLNPKNILEAGCGTSKWLKDIFSSSRNLFGIDYSFEMLKVGLTENEKYNLVNADAVSFPFKENIFDMIFCINSIHHFTNKKSFFIEALRTLNNKGIIAIYGADPHLDKDWYLYEFFENVLENDLKRFPSFQELRATSAEAGFKEINIETIEEIYFKRIGEEVFNDPFLKKSSNSQLLNLTEEEYQKGVERIKNKIEENPKTEFITSLKFYLLQAKKSLEE